MQAASDITIDNQHLLDTAREVLSIEADAIRRLSERLDQRFIDACELLLGCAGRIVVCGVGKTGHIGAKLAATLASTGSPAFFLHAAEASHGDLGMLREDDVVIALSHSGSSSELMTILPAIRRHGVPIISLCGTENSPLVKASDVWLDTRIDREACPLGLAPTASTTASLALGDALAVALLTARGFDETDFARSHPGGRLGRQLLLGVDEVMKSGEEMPVVGPEASLKEALLEISRKGLGMVIVVDASGTLLGVFTDGDLRRTLEHTLAIDSVRIGDIMTVSPITIASTTLAAEALKLMQSRRITALPVVDEDGFVAGVVTMHALLAAGLA
ncbi:MAG: D-arabinose 5-phosphate isomerase [Gammaproteobacteria bacterium]|nr:MAG: D-arabinose 5-phosphate isomerase [Gammaproteobacteria bacterium]PIE37605.1 MAG: D-arabinose 5-phosphate isomerase [Gammaproteobacteria bacterium]